jgi:hypothetical protein
MEHELHVQRQQSPHLVTRQATLEDAHSLAPRLRAQDLIELRAQNSSPIDALLYGVTESRPCLCVTLDDLPITLFGVVPDGGDQGRIWLLGSIEIVKVKFSFLRQSKPTLDVLCKDFAVVSNAVHADNDLHIRWLYWLGFTFHDHFYIGRHKFIYFRKVIDRV